MEETMSGLKHLHKTIIEENIQGALEDIDNLLKKDFCPDRFDPPPKGIFLTYEDIKWMKVKCSKLIDLYFGHHLKET
jgi:hypothetical protein